MAWVADPEFPSEEYNTFTPMVIFAEDEVRLAEVEAQVMAEVRERYEADPVKGPRSLWYNPWSSANLGAGWRWPVNDKPYRYRLKQPADWLPDIGPAFSERFVNTIEMLEPGVHQYLPSELYDPDGSFRERRWLLNICTSAETIIPERSNIVVSPYGRFMIGNGAFQVSASAVAIRGRAIWNEYRVPLRLVSEDFVAIAREQNMRGWTYHRHIDEI